jgi:hypothetical protein
LLILLAVALRCAVCRYRQAINLLDKYVQGQYGTGRWMEMASSRVLAFVLRSRVDPLDSLRLQTIASCLYAVARQNRKPITLGDLAVSLSNSL